MNTSTATQPFWDGIDGEIHELSFEVFNNLAHHIFEGGQALNVEQRYTILLIFVDAAIQIRHTFKPETPPEELRLLTRLQEMQDGHQAVEKSYRLSRNKEDLLAALWHLADFLYGQKRYLEAEPIFRLLIPSVRSEYGVDSEEFSNVDRKLSECLHHRTLDFSQWVDSQPRSDVQVQPDMQLEPKMQPILNDMQPKHESSKKQGKRRACSRGGNRS